MCEMKNLFSILFTYSFSFYCNADNAFLIDDNTLHNWGYKTQSFKKEINQRGTIRHQFIKSLKQAKGLENHYYYYSLSQECYSGYFSALARRIGLLVTDEKDYTLSELSGKCVRICNTSANFATFNEQPRIFKLFNKYLNNKN